MKNNQSKDFRVLPQRKSFWFCFDRIFPLRPSCSQIAGGCGLEPKSNKAALSQPPRLTIRPPSSHPVWKSSRSASRTKRPQAAWCGWNPTPSPRRCPPDWAANSAPTRCPKWQIQAPPAPGRHQVQSHTCGGKQTVLLLGSWGWVCAGAQGTHVAPHQPGAEDALPNQGALDITLEENKI